MDKKMEIAKLKMLGIEMPLGKFTEFHDDGFVKNMEEYRMKLRRKYKLSYKKDERDVFGRCFSFPCEKTNKVYQHIFYLNNYSAPLNVQARAHEETHALEYQSRVSKHKKYKLKNFDGLEILSDKILNEQKVKINFKDIEEEEIRANLGSIYALFKRNLDPNIITPELFSNLRYFDIAMKIYEQSKFTKVNIF